MELVPILHSGWQSAPHTKGTVGRRDDKKQSLIKRSTHSAAQDTYRHWRLKHGTEQLTGFSSGSPRSTRKEDRHNVTLTGVSKSSEAGNQYVPGGRWSRLWAQHGRGVKAGTCNLPSWEERLTLSTVLLSKEPWEGRQWAWYDPQDAGDMVRQGAGARQRHPRYLPQQPVRIPTAPPCQVATKAATEGSPGERRKA